MTHPRREFLLAGAALAAGCATPSLPPPAVAPGAPSVRVGDRWHYARINRYNGLLTGEPSMRVVEAGGVIRIAVTDPRNTGPFADEIYARPWDVIQEPAYGHAIQFDDPCPLLPARLEAGAKARYAGRYKVPDVFGSFFWSAWVDAEAWERVTVPAGAFDALRVRRRIRFQSIDSARIDPQRDETLWYAPQVNRWVRREWTGRWIAPGFPQMMMREDWVAWDLLEYAPAAR